MRNTFGDFNCAHCGAFVSVMHELSGVNNRNHCPYCLWSRHLDLYSAGDRLSACRGQMKPSGLTMKKGRNKYASSARGELMLVHECVDCCAVSINRIAGDDDPDSIVEIFHASIDGDHDYEEIVMLKAEDREEVLIQLYGHLRSPFLLA